MLRENLNSVSLAGMSTVSTVRMHRWKQHKLWTNHCVDHTPQCRFMCNSSYSNTSLQWRCSRSVQMSNLPPDYQKAWQRTDLTSHFARGSVACWVGLSNRMALHTVCSRMHLYGHPCCTHSTATLTNCEPCELVAKRIFYALQVRTRTIYKKSNCLKNIFCHIYR